MSNYCSNGNAADDALLAAYFADLNPAWTPDDSSTDEARRFVTVPITKLYGDALFGKLRGVRVDTGATIWLRLVLINPNTGSPQVITVGQYSEAPQVQVRYREATGVDPRVYTPDDADVGELSPDGRSCYLPLPIELKNNPGVYRAQVRVTRASDGLEVARDEFLVLMERGFWNTDGDAFSTDDGPPTVQELRTAARDHPAANRLLGEYEYDLAELGNSMVAAVQAFNSEFPPLPCNLTTRDFPPAWRRQWLDGSLAYLAETAANYMRRGTLPYQASGLSVDDLNKEREYLGMAQMYRERYQRFVKLKRMQINMNSAWGSVGSGYRSGTY